MHMDKENQPVPPTSTPITETPASSSIAETVPSFRTSEAKTTKPLPVKTIGLVVGGIVAVVVGVIAIKFVMGQVRNPQVTQTAQAKKVNLTWWGLWEPNEVLTSEIKDFQNQNPGVTITYAQQSVKDYRERLQSAFSRNQGPDIFRFHNTWVPMLAAQNLLSTVPSTVMSGSEYQTTFYPVVSRDMKTQGGMVGVPLMTDGLALFINKKALAASGKQAPTTWEELSQLGKDLTIRSVDGKIDRAGVALGSANNVDHFSDILALLILQNGGNPGVPNDPKNLVSDALTFYTQFLRIDRVWDETLPNSTYAFAIEKAAMMFAPSWRAFEIKQINPNLDFAVYPVPQLPGKPVSFASYWVEGVSKTSPNQDVAWKFLKFMSSKASLQKLYTSASSQRLFGEPYPRVDMSADVVNDPYIGAFIKQAPNTQSWYMSGRTFDGGINDQIIKYYQDAINSINTGGSLTDALPPLTQGVSSVLTKYNIRP